VRVRASQAVQSEIPGPLSPSIAQTCGRYHDRDRSGRSARVSRPKVLAILGVSAVLKPTIDALRAKLAVLLTA
jgi:hypothetical protein